MSGNIVDASDSIVTGFILTKAVKEVIKTMSGLELLEDKADTGPAQAAAAASAPAPVAPTPAAARIPASSRTRITGLSILAGEQYFLIKMDMPRDTAIILVVYMTGMNKADVKDSDLNDGVAEMCNMVAGHMKAQLVNNGHHNIKVLSPLVVTGEGHGIVLKSKTESLVKRYRSGSIDIIAGASMI